MIDFQVNARASGKTTEIAKMYERTGGRIIFPTERLAIAHSQLNRNMPYYECDCALKFKQIIERIGCYLKFMPKNLYFDEFCLQLFITFDDLIELDKRGFNIIVRTSLYKNTIPEFFTDYIKENYPEYCV